MKIDFQNAILLVLCLCVFFGVLTLSACAATQYLPISEYPNPDGFVYGHFYLNSQYTWDELASSDVDCIVVGVLVNGENTTPQIYAFSNSPGVVYYSTTKVPAYSEPTSTLTLEPYENLYYTVLPTWKSDDRYSYSYVENVFTTIEDAYEYADSVFPDSSSFQYSLPPGNVAYIEMGSSSGVKLSMDFPEMSNSFGTPFSKANSAYALEYSLPTAGSPVASGTIIPWSKSGPLNLIGQTSLGVFGPIGPIATRYVAIINPSYYDHVMVTGTYRQNPPIQIEALNVLSIRVYPLQSDFTFSDDTGQVNTTIAGDAYSGDVDAETGDIYWTDPNGGTSAPPLGGNNLPEAGNSIFDTLRNIAGDFAEFLKGPVSAIRIVIGAIRDFMGSFTQLYMWLPSPVYNLITAALMIAITIGVIKIFV